MILNSAQIKDRDIISGKISSHFRNASYDLGAATIIDMKGEKHSHYKLLPQGMVILVSKERIKLPKDIVGFAHVKTSLTQKGIMATNIGIIDPGYEGYLSTLLINFGSSSETLHENDRFLRLTFSAIDSKYEAEKPSGSIKIEEYIKLRQKDTDNLSEKFLNLSTVNDEVFKKVIKSLIGLGIIFSAGSFAISMYFQNKSSHEKDMDKVIKSYDYQNSLLINQNKTLQLQLDTISKALKISDKRLQILEKK